jgi:hypothetical protein
LHPVGLFLQTTDSRPTDRRRLALRRRGARLQPLGLFLQTAGTQNSQRFARKVQIWARGMSSGTYLSVHERENRLLDQTNAYFFSFI